MESGAASRRRAVRATNSFGGGKAGNANTDLRANDPGLSVTARRIDGDAPVVHVADATNAKLQSGWAMLLMLEIPTSGCWEITGNYRADSLSMVVWVPNKALDETQ